MLSPLQAQGSSTREEENNGQSKKRFLKNTPSSSSTAQSSSNSVFLRKGMGNDDSEEAMWGLQCPICHEMLQEPMISTCGHTFCKMCIMQALDFSLKCPRCWTPLTKDKVFPNDAMRFVIAKRAREKKDSQYCGSSASGGASVSSPSEIEDVLLGATDVDDLNLCGVDNLLLLLQRKRELMVRDEESTKQNLVTDFLSRLQARKDFEMNRLSWELSMIKGDLEALMNTEEKPELLLKIFKTDDSTYSTSSRPAPSSGFNTQPLRNVEAEQKAFAMKKMRMHTLFDELTRTYFETKKSEIIDDATVPRSHGVEGFEQLANFSQILTRSTQYHGLKLLATLSMADKDLDPPHDNIVASIEFDKDNEFFAAACTKRIQLFKYITVIGAGCEGKKGATAELSTGSIVSCVAWNPSFKNSLASSDLDGCVLLWDVEKKATVRGFMEHQRRVWSVDWNASHPTLLASGSNDTTVKLWSSNTSKSIANLELQARVFFVKFCPQSVYTVACGGEGHHVYHYDLRNAKVPIGVFKGHDNVVSDVEFTAESEFVSVSADNTLKLWNLEEPTGSVKSFKGHVNERKFVGLATDGNYVICGSENNSLYLYSKFLPTPLFAFQFDSHWRNLAEGEKAVEFVCAATWRKGSPVAAAGNSLGTIKLFELK